MLVSNELQPIGTGTSMRSFHFAKALGEFGDLTIVALSADTACSARATQLNAEIISAETVRKVPPGDHPAGRSDVMSVVAFPWLGQWSGLLRYVVALQNESPSTLARRLLAVVIRTEFALASRFFNPLPLMSFWVRDFFMRIRQKSEAAMRSGGFDIVWVEHAFNFPWLEELLAHAPVRPRVVCNTHNIEFDLARQLANFGGTRAERRMWRSQQNLLYRWETHAFRESDVTVVCSEDDRSVVLKEVPDANVVIASNGVDTSYFTRSATRRDREPTLLFTGLFSYQPNIDASLFFLADVYPLIKRELPDCRVIFAGRQAAAAFARLDLPAGVEIVTDPHDMRPQFDRAWIFVAPLRLGGGTRLKILEAMAMECPVVSTRMGCSGLPVQPDKHLLVEDTPVGFATAVIRLARDSEQRKRFAQDALELVRDRFDWSAVAGKGVKNVIMAISKRERK
jgi:glycosyltransferase involved in cell wall biosynthesis